MIIKHDNTSLNDKDGAKTCEKLPWSFAQTVYFRNSRI